MASKKHIDTVADLNKPYEENTLGLKGILWFGVGLFLLIVITFGLMWALLNVLDDTWKETAGPANPMRMNERERLPAEPRLQLAPGFGVDAPTGRVNLELREPQAEYRELKKIWDDMLQHGQKDPASGAVSSLPIEEAKQRLLGQGIKAKTDDGAAEVFERSKMSVSASSSGRMQTVKRR